MGTLLIPKTLNEGYSVWVYSRCFESLTKTKITGPQNIKAKDNPTRFCLWYEKARLYNEIGGTQQQQD